MNQSLTARVDWRDAGVTFFRNFPNLTLRLDDLTVANEGRFAGDTVAGPLKIERSRSYHREWLVKFAGVENRDALDPFRAHLLGVPQDALGPLAEDEVYLHELDGFSVRLEDDTPLGLVSAVYDLPAGILIEVQGPKREFLLPYKKEFVKQVDRAGRRLMVTLPEGLLD